jgi:hypothetical protein
LQRSTAPSAIESRTPSGKSSTSALLTVSIATGNAAFIWGFANEDRRLVRQTHEEAAALIEQADLEQQMRDFGVWKGRASGARGRHE